MLNCQCLGNVFCVSRLPILRCKAVLRLQQTFGSRWYFVPNVTSSPIPMVNVASCLNPWYAITWHRCGVLNSGFSKVVFCLNVFLLRPVICWLAFPIHWHSGITVFSWPPYSYSMLNWVPSGGYGISRERGILPRISFNI